MGEDLETSIFEFDYVWVHSQLIPLSFEEQPGTVSREHVPDGKRLPAFIFNHMSALDTSPDERSYIPLLEEPIASAEVFVSQEARAANCTGRKKLLLSETRQSIHCRLKCRCCAVILAMCAKN